MAVKIENIFVENFASTKNWIFLFCVVALSVSFLCCLLLSVFRNNYSLRKRVWYFSASCGIIVLSSSVLGKSVLTHIIICLCSVYFGIIFSLPKREKNTASDFDEYIDRQIDMPSNYERGINHSRSVEEKLKPTPTTERNKGSEIDFSHVKSIIERINLLSLTQADRKTVKDLELNVISAENGDDRYETKQKINEGLGALLKIMSKYGA